MSRVAPSDSISGWTLAESFASEKPSLKVIYTSGYPVSKLACDFREGLNFLQKPFTLPHLAQTVRKALGFREAED